ncbi:MAG: DNA methylase [Oscillospiraceae bacterium]|nr:DNA methylase [Oscillospiraceae bacterium]
MESEKTYLCIDLKSFYASVECVERGLDPLTTNLVVADKSRTEKTICLAVSPSMKKYGIPGRARLFEVIQKVKEVNAQRRRKTPGRMFAGKSFHAKELERNAQLELDYIVAPPRMALYIEYSTRIYNVYLKYIAPEDIHVYSIDEVFIDLTPYLPHSVLNAHEFAIMMIKDVLKTTGITATAGIGTNMYLAKVAMDIVAKKMPADKDGVRIAELDEMSYRRQLWGHRPLPDFWRIGHGYAQKLEANGMYTMGDIARCSVGWPESYHNEELLYKLFGVNAELLTDHAWGWEPCTIEEIKAYRPENNSISTGQVLQHPYDYEGTKLIIKEMADLLALDLVEKGLVTDQIVLTVGYDIENLAKDNSYSGEIKTDYYGRKVPKHAHSTANIRRYTSSSKLITDAVLKLFDEIIDRKLLTRRVNITAGRVVAEGALKEEKPFQQLNFFEDFAAKEEKLAKEKAAFEREKRQQKAIAEIKKRYGKNAILKGMNFEEGGMTIDRNGQIGGHRA